MMEESASISLLREHSSESSLSLIGYQPGGSSQQSSRQHKHPNSALESWAAAHKVLQEHLQLEEGSTFVACQCTCCWHSP